MKLNSKQLEQYKATARTRQANKDKANKQRFLRAWEIARAAAELLKNKYRVSKVVVFGSLVHENLFHGKSDIDLAAWGLDNEEYYQVVAWLQDFDPNFSIDLVIMPLQAKKSLKETINVEGVEL